MAAPLDQRVTKSIRVAIAIAVGLGMVSTNKIFPGWEQVFLATVVVIGFLIVQFSELWNLPKFWLLLLAVSTIHCWVMVALQPLMNELRFFSTLIVVLVESFAFFVLFRRVFVLQIEANSMSGRNSSMR